MKGSGTTNIVIGMLFIIVMASVAVNYKLYKECTDKIDLAAKQSGTMNAKITDFEMNMDGLKLSMETLKSDMQVALTKAGQPEEFKSEIAAKIDAIKKDLVDMKANYTTAINEVNAKLSALKSEKAAVSPAKESTADDNKVDLGEISVPTPE